MRFPEVKYGIYLGKFGSWELGTEQGTKKFGFAIFALVLGIFGSVLGILCLGLVER